MKGVAYSVCDAPKDFLYSPYLCLVLKEHRCIEVRNLQVSSNLRAYDMLIPEVNQTSQPALCGMAAEHCPDVCCWLARSHDDVVSNI